MANHNEVAHAWAHQTGRNRRGFNMFYEGETIYSYGHHFPIATIKRDAEGRTLVLFTTQGYSVSTSKHKTYTARACAHLPTICVPNVRPIGTHDHNANHAALLAMAQEALEKAARAYKYADLHLSDAQRFIGDANQYNTAFALGLPAATMPADLGEVRERIAKARAEAARKEREAEAKAAEDIEKWVRGEVDHVPHTRLPHVRVKGDQVETSWGIRVPLAEALPLFRLAQRCAARHEAFTPNGDPIMVGWWRLDRIAEDGTIRAGCHVIPLERQQHAAQVAGLEG